MPVDQILEVRFVGQVHVGHEASSCGALGKSRAPMAGATDPQAAGDELAECADLRIGQLIESFHGRASNVVGEIAGTTAEARRTHAAQGPSDSELESARLSRARPCAAGTAGQAQRARQQDLSKKKG